MLELNGAEQFVMIRGTDKSKPVLLFLHGGPGFPWSWLHHSTLGERYEEAFVTVHWDQRGAGRSYSSGAAHTLSVQQLVDDTNALADILRERFGQEKIYLLGWSWGSVLGFHTVSQAPEKYHAYFATGVSTAEDEKTQNACLDWLEFEAAERGDTGTAQALANERAGQEQVECPLNLVAAYGGALYGKDDINSPVFSLGARAPEYRPLDYVNLMRGMTGDNRAVMVEDMWRYGDLPSLVPSLDVPTYFFLGRHDYQTPSSVAADYFESLDAPRKRLVWFEESAHMPFYEESERFFQELMKIKDDLGTAEAKALAPVSQATTLALSLGQRDCCTTSSNVFYDNGLLCRCPGLAYLFSRGYETVPSYSARPTIAPSRPSSSYRSKSVSVATPPPPTSAWEKAARIALTGSGLTPFRVPSRVISV